MDKEEVKAYDKDGAHAHTEDEPLGLHNHPEIEERLREALDFVHNRIDSLLEKVDPEVSLKRYGKGGKKRKKETKQDEEDPEEAPEPEEAEREQKSPLNQCVDQMRIPR